MGQERNNKEHEVEDILVELKVRIKVMMERARTMLRPMKTSPRLLNMLTIKMVVECWKDDDTVEASTVRGCQHQEKRASDRERGGRR